MKPFPIHYHWAGRTWRTVVLALDRTEALERFRRLYPHVRPLNSHLSTLN